ncbi:hypothetical protein ARAM_001816 [Aspergillus rambellii]|uniref:Tryptophan synthase beta chain-like PALP domain-containing protein n=1 Tax=Aspergillus rambellii TaxID=308745 RepID=A0A0F8X104_9EURO|nr:hypothetical protein ARAM_001816 [Aspergillus rambellii]
MSAMAKEKSVTLFAPTQGNHGRAVAFMARILGIGCRIFVSHSRDQPTMMVEIENQLAHMGLQGSVMFTPVGVGSLANTVATFCSGWILCAKNTFKAEQNLEADVW